jgi:hypothetical protein
LDSYDDRWTPPTPIALTPEQSDIEQEAASAFAAIKQT